MEVTPTGRLSSLSQDIFGFFGIGIIVNFSKQDGISWSLNDQLKMSANTGESYSAQ